MDELHLVEVLVLPAHAGEKPRYGQKAFPVDERRGNWLPVAAGMSGVQAPIAIGQSEAFFVLRLEGGSAARPFSKGRLGLLFVA